MAVMLRWKGQTTVPVEAECVRPDGLAGKSAGGVGGLVVRQGKGGGGAFVWLGERGGGRGAGMKRGTIAVFSRDGAGEGGGASGPRLLPTFRYDCEYRPMFVQVYLRRRRGVGVWGGG